MSSTSPRSRKTDGYWSWIMDSRNLAGLAEAWCRHQDANLDVMDEILRNKKLQQLKKEEEEQLNTYFNYKNYTEHSYLMGSIVDAITEGSYIEINNDEWTVGDEIEEYHTDDFDSIDDIISGLDDDIRAKKTIMVYNFKNLNE
jgi:hypothetical protein